MGKRLKISTREVATIQGAVKYVGAPCKNGHDGTRYTKSGICVACHASRDRTDLPTPRVISMDQAEAAENRQNARSRGSTHYRGAECKHGHDGVRYVSTGSCVACHGLNAKAPRLVGSVGRLDLARDKDVALRMGDQLYVGTPCEVGHQTGHGIRWVVSDACIECELEANLSKGQADFAALEPGVWAAGRMGRLRRYVKRHLKPKDRKELHDL